MLVLVLVLLATSYVLVSANDDESFNQGNFHRVLNTSTLHYHSW